MTDIPAPGARTEFPFRRGSVKQLETLVSAGPVLRKFQRHVILRTFGDDGQVLADNLEASSALDTVLEALGIDALGRLA